jgi:hypothetical protein
VRLEPFSKEKPRKRKKRKKENPETQVLQPISGFLVPEIE